MPPVQTPHTKTDFTIYYVYQLLSLLRANALDTDVFREILSSADTPEHRNDNSNKCSTAKRPKSKRSKRRRRTFQEGDLLTTSQAASVLGVSSGSLSNLRCAGGGPEYSKLGPRIVRYRYEDLVSFVEQRKYQNTSQYDASEANAEEVK